MPACGLVFLFLPIPSFGAEKKEEKKAPEPPSIVMVLPLAISPGVTNKVKIRGQNLTNVTEVRFTNSELHVEYTIKSKGKAEVPKDADVKKFGDAQIDLQITLPTNAPAGLTGFTLVSTNGESKPGTIVIVPSGKLVQEKESNGSFREAQPLEFGKFYLGSIGEAKDVDVFKIQCKAGQMITAEVQAARYGSSLDALLTLYDEHGHQVASSDDSEYGSDAVLHVKISHDGAYLLSLMDANDKGGATFVYLLSVKTE
jgi:hypothetical protein